MNKIAIGNTNVSIKEYQGERVVTLKDIDIVHERPDGTARRNFNTNKHRFIEGEDYFKVCADEIRTHKIMAISSKVHEDVTLLTESGYLMIVKSFTDDLSWDIQRELVKCYFKLKELAIPIATPLPYFYTNKTYHARPIMTASDIANIFGVNLITLYNFIKTKLTPTVDYDSLQGETLKDYIKENPDLPHCRKSMFVIYNTGLSRIAFHFGLDTTKIPKFMTEKRGYVVQAEVRKLMEYVRKELKGAEALTYLIESDDSAHNLENYRRILVQKLSMINWWSLDVSAVKLGVHNITETERNSIHNGDYGIKY